MNKKLIIGVIFILLLGSFVYYEYFSKAKALKILRNEVLESKDEECNFPNNEKCIEIINCVADEVEEHYKDQKALPEFAREVKRGEIDFLELGIIKTFAVGCGLDVTIQKDFFDKINTTNEN